MKNGVPGLWVSQKRLRTLDGRTRISKALKALRARLERDLGGDLSAQESVLLDRVVFLIWKVTIYEAQLLNGKEGNEIIGTFYLSWVNSLRLILRELGLKRVPKDVSDPLAKLLSGRDGDEVN